MNNKTSTIELCSVGNKTEARGTCFGHPRLVAYQGQGGTGIKFQSRVDIKILLKLNLSGES